MGQFYGSDANKAAVETVVAALEHGTMNLLGPVHRDDVVSNGKADATYLATLLNELSRQLSNTESE